MTYADLINFFDGNKQIAAAALGVTAQTLYNWDKKGIPAKSLEAAALKIERIKMDEAAQKELENERYQRLYQAFGDAINAGTSQASLDVLAMESGFSREDLDKLLIA